MSMMDDEDEDVGVGREAASPMSRGRPSKVFRPSAAGTEVTRTSPTYSDEGREEYDPQPEYDDEDVTQTTNNAVEDDDEEEEEDQEVRAGPSKKAGKGKRSVVAAEEEDEAEEGMGGMDDYDTQGDDVPQDEEQEQEEEEEEEEEPMEEEEPEAAPSKKGKGKEKAVAPKPKPAKKKVASPTRKRECFSFFHSSLPPPREIKFDFFVFSSRLLRSRRHVRRIRRRLWIASKQTKTLRASRVLARREARLRSTRIRSRSRAYRQGGPSSPEGRSQATRWWSSRKVDVRQAQAAEEAQEGARRRRQWERWRSEGGWTSS